MKMPDGRLFTCVALKGDKFGGEGRGFLSSKQRGALRTSRTVFVRRL
jgi:hypothetical protein